MYKACSAVYVWMHRVGLHTAVSSQQQLLGLLHSGTITVQSLPDLLVIHGNRHEMAVAWLLPLWLMVVWHVIVTLSTCVATASETVQGRGKHAEQHWIKVCAQFDPASSLVTCLAVERSQVLLP